MNKMQLNLLVALIPMGLLLTHCGSTVTAKRMDPAEAWENWRGDAAWKREHAAALAKLRAAGLDKVYKEQPVEALAQLRALSDKKTELHSAVAILAADLAGKRGSKSDSLATRGLWLVSAQGAYYAAKETPVEVLRADNGAPARFMADLYNRAVEQFVSLDFAAGGLRGAKSNIIPAPGGDFIVVENRSTPGALDPGWFDELVPTDSVAAKGLTDKASLPGVGATFVGIRKRTPEREKEMAFASKRGRYLPLTALAKFPAQHGSSGTSRVEIMVIDPTVARDIPFGTRSVPVSRDCATPLALQMNGLSGSSMGLGGFIHVEDRMKMAGLYMLRPYDPNRIPVVMIHGLQSSPLIWRNLIAELEADPKISARYQFWVIYYPSGMAVPYSRKLIVDQLAAVRKNYDPQGHDLASRNMVVIGHSMGGVLSRSLITDVGDRFWGVLSDKDFSEANLSADQREEVRQLVFFKPVPQVQRAIFFSAPHRGAKMADGWLGRFGSRLVRLPLNIVKLQVSIVAPNANILRDPTKMKGAGNSIRSLSPGAPIYQALNSSPFVPGVPYHTVVGDRGKGDSPNSTDGFVPYSSSHLTGAESELIVPTGHGSYESPLSVAETKRILLKHLQGK
ncbi:MAG: alpha/beta hydrolase [Verrucomicrobia bacterium]|nr:alpha/beta hydrolase [Verrucomicrobiota bacterium]